MNRASLTPLRKFPGFALLIAIALAATSTARASSLPPVNLPEMVRQADRIVVGRAVSEWTGRDQHRLPATITTFEISQVLKGGPIGRIEVKQLGVTQAQPDGLAVWIDGMPRYQQGAEYLLFLNPDSVYGFTMPVGAFQGAFEVRPAERGKKSILNAVNNANLLRGLEAEDMARLGLTPDRFPFVSRGRGPMHLDEIAGMIERLGDGKGVSR
jgi:hypothetical protein